MPDKDRVNRSRMVLIGAWGLLAVGMLVQVLWPQSSDGDIAGTDAADQLAFGAGDADPATDDGTEAASNRSSTDTNLTTTDTGPGAGTSAGTDGAVLTADDPALWSEAGTVLASESSVATVTTTGVAALAEPAPGAVQHFFPNPTQFGSVRTFLVVDQTSSEDYIKVALPVKPNGQEGWIPRSEVEITTVGHRALVDLSDDSVTVWNGDEVIVDTKAVTGKPSTPTPVGVFYVRDVIAQPNVGGSYGPYILALSGFSEVLETFNGGLPALAIHGTNNPDQIGSERSSGCVRIPNDLITILADTVPLGTPVTIVA